MRRTPGTVRRNADDAMQVQDRKSGLATVAAYACFESIQANAVAAVDADADAVAAVAGRRP